MQLRQPLLERPRLEVQGSACKRIGMSPYAHACGTVKALRSSKGYLAWSNPMYIRTCCHAFQRPIVICYDKVHRFGEKRLPERAMQPARRSGYSKTWVTKRVRSSRHGRLAFEFRLQYCSESAYRSLKAAYAAFGKQSLRLCDASCETAINNRSP